MNILVVKPSSLGDIIHTFPAVDLIRRELPDAHISWVVSDAFAGIVELYPGVDEIILFQRHRLGRLQHIGELFSFLRDLRQRSYDIAIDFQGLLRSGLMTFFSGASQRIGFHNSREGARLFYNERVMLPANLRHAVDRNIFLARSGLGLGGTVTIPALKSQHDYVKQAKILLKRHGLQGASPIIAVGAAARWPSKCCPPDTYAQILDSLSERLPEAKFWLLGTAAEREVAAAVIAGCRRAVPVDLSGQTNLGTLTELLRQSHVLLTNDSGPMHLGAALGIPVVAFFGSTDPTLTGPYGPQHAVFRSTCDSSPCFSRVCPRNGKCWDNLNIADVVEAVRDRVLKSPGSAEPASAVPPQT